MLRVDPRQQRRLAEIIANLRERIEEATINRWMGEVKGLQVSLEAAKSKMDRLVKSAATRTSASVNMGIPTIHSPNRPALPQEARDEKGNDHRRY